jgi:hypothetical protein
MIETHSYIPFQEIPHITVLYLSEVDDRGRLARLDVGGRTLEVGVFGIPSAERTFLRSREVHDIAHVILSHQHQHLKSQAAIPELGRDFARRI